MSIRESFTNKNCKNRIAVIFLCICAAVNMTACNAADENIQEISTSSDESISVSSVSDPMEELKLLADKGDAAALSELGILYYEGTTITQSFEKAAQCFENAIENGASESGELKVLLGMMCQKEEIPGGMEKAYDWYYKAACDGDATGMQFTASCLENGSGVTQNMEEAVSWYQKAAEAQDAFSMRKMAAFFMDGVVVSQNTEEAIDWLKEAAYAGDGLAMRTLGCFYDVGEYVEQSDSEAAMWYERAANAGDVQAMFLIGTMYYNAKGVEGSYQLAAKWLNSALEGGYEEARVWVDTLKAAGF